ncbi:MAG: hypothetical protein ACJ763_08405 [Bdellovibrionia bacterium]
MRFAEKPIERCATRSFALALLFAVLAPLMGGANAMAATSSELETTGNKLSHFSLSYIVSFPTASTADFLGNAVSYRGLGIEWNAPTGLDDLYWGFSLRWLYFRHDEDNESITSGNTTVTGRIYRSVDSFPISLNLKYPFKVSSSSRVQPFIGLGVGTTYGRRELNVGAYSQNQYGWQFLMAPEAGTEVKFSRTGETRGFFNVRYDAGFGSDAISAISNLSLAIGIASNFD